MRRWRRSCGDQVVPEALQARAMVVGSRSCVRPGGTGGRVAVLARRERGEDGGVKVGREGDPAPATAFLDRAADAPARVGLVEVAAAKALLLELAARMPVASRTSRASA